MLNKNLKFYLTALLVVMLICFCMVEAISYFALQRIQRTSSPPDFIDFYQRYNSQVNHLRDPELVVKYPEIFKVPQSLLFDQIGHGPKIILMQGDSWAEHALFSSAARKELTEFVKNRYTFINAGTSSYSASPMSAQLNILRDDFHISPEVVISAFDQTDIGDELCRYRDLRQKVSGEIVVKPFPLGSHELYAIEHMVQSDIALRSTNLNAVKLAKLAWYGYQLKAYRTQNPIRCGWNAISSYLNEGVSEKDQAYLITVFDDYINTVFANPDTQQLILVTHPHRHHLEGTYQFNVASLMYKALQASAYRSKIALIDFDRLLKRPFTSSDLDRIYLQGDLASHLNDAYYVDEYLPKILDIIQH